MVTRAEAHAKGLRHKNVNVMVFSRDGRKFLGQIRAADKDVFAGAISNGAAGHVKRGAGSIETALTEGAQEIATKDGRRKLEFLEEHFIPIGEEYEHDGYLRMYEFSWLNEGEKEKLMSKIKKELANQDGLPFERIFYTVNKELSTVYLFTYNRVQTDRIERIAQGVEH